MNYFALTILLFLGANIAHAKEENQHRRRVLASAKNILENYNISYIYGGRSLGSPEDCERCSQCLDLKQPKKQQQLQACPECSNCALDCSHFTHWVLKKAGLPSSYLPTQQMLELSPQTLKNKYNLVDIGTNVALSQPGDLLVYVGHVVMLEKRHSPIKGDIIHATSGSDVRGPGNGVQRKRHVNLIDFRGPLQRILRHVNLENRSKAPFRPITRRSHSQGEEVSDSRR